MQIYFWQYSVEACSTGVTYFLLYNNKHKVYQCVSGYVGSNLVKLSDVEKLTLSADYGTFTVILPND